MRTVIPKGAILVPPQANRVFKGIIYDVYQWQQERFDGSTAPFEMLKRPDTVKVLAVTDDDQIVTVLDEQPVRGTKLTLPGGRHDIESETELDCAKRELLEETGMRFTHWKLVLVTQPFTKVEQFVYIFMATGEQTKVAAQPDPGEKIKVKKISFAEAKHIASQTPLNPYWPNELLWQAQSLAELRALPEYT